ncbi:S-layer homology domain-containing protein [Pyramidobacter piscolens]|uniref:S-layer homology domain-containing protein n=5 Tax=Pyramidobacter TaxID=638847 RepID=UPI002665CD90|nr:S-layer homology domain-containing protein [Pyramidobacter piscolens]
MSLKKMLAVVAAASLVAAAAPAFAANPFSDVPMNHWAYDAVEQLSAKGILEGYPNGTFKGNRAMTRYEIATMVARMMAAGGLSGEDLEKLKALVVEFQPELEALGVKVDGFDSRLSALEKGVGGWRISGEMQFDFNGGRDDLEGNHGFEFDSARLFLHRDLSDKVSFDAEWGDDTFDRFYLTAEDFLGWEGFTVKAGQFDIDWEDDDGLYYGEHEDAGLFQGLTYRGFGLSKSFGLAEVSGFAASNRADDGWSVYDRNESGEYYGARLKLNFNEKFWLSANGYWVRPEGKSAAEWGSDDFAAYWAALGFKFADGLELKGAYYMEDIDGAAIDDPKAWKVALDVSQDVLKFTSLWVEYAQFDQGFIAENLPYAFGKLGDYLDGFTTFGADTDVIFVAAKQEWNDKWSTFGRYAQYDPDGGDKAKDWAVGVGYQYSPNLYFELAYNKMDVGANGVPGFEDGSFIRFRTLLTF